MSPERCACFGAEHAPLVQGGRSLGRPRPPCMVLVMRSGPDEGSTEKWTKQADVRGAENDKHNAECTHE